MRWCSAVALARSTAVRSVSAIVLRARAAEEGDFLDAVVKDGEIVLRVKRLVDKEHAWFWTRRWQEGEREAQEDIDAGRIHSFASAWHDAGLFGIYAGTGADEAKELLPIVCDELLKLPHDISEEERVRAGAQLKAGILMAREKTSARCEHIASQLLVHDRIFSPAEIVAKVDAVGPVDLARVARRLLASAPTLTAMGPVGNVMDLASLRRRLQG
jgi:hypothetical protein